MEIRKLVTVVEETLKEMGRDVSPATRKAAAIAVIKNPYAGQYVEDLTPLLERAEVFVVPLSSGSGVRVKILDAFTWGIPVVSTTVGVEGLDARDSEHLLVADDPASFGAAVLRCLKDPDFAADMARRARELVESTYAWPVVNQALDAVIDDIMGSD